MTAPAAVGAVSDKNDKYAWLDSTHPIYDEHVDRWTENERRLRGGDYVLDELRRFRWETLPGMTLSTNENNTVVGEHYLARQQQAVYINFPEMFTLAMKGHLFRNRPLPGTGLNFGKLGEVRRERNFSAPTNAEILYYNADGIGNDGSQWDNFWFSAWERAAATGHRWMYAEAPATPPRNQQDVLNGLRPYMVEFAPQQVPNWNFTRGRLDWAIVRLAVRAPKVTNGSLEGNDSAQGYLLLVRKGVDALGDEFKSGGWFTFDADRNPTDATGNWDRTAGEIPMSPLFYERDSGVTGSIKASPRMNWKELLGTTTRPTVPAMSRPAITELGQLSVAFMNMLSAADFDAWDAAASVRFLLGVDKDSYNIAAAMWDAGSQTVPVPETKSGAIPQLQDGSAGAVAAEVFDKLLARALKLAEKIAVQEVSGTPESSGMSKRMGFGELKAPRLANIASELEQAQNTAIRFLEMRWGNAAPGGSTAWKREFEIADVVEDVREFFEVEALAKLTSPTLDARLLVRAAKARGFTTDDADEKTIEGEYTESAERRDQASSLDASFGGGGATEDDEEEVPGIPAPTTKTIDIEHPDGRKSKATVTG